METCQLVSAPLAPVRSLMNLAEAADYLRLSARTVQRLLTEKQLRAARVHRRLIFKKSELDHYVNLQTALGV